MNYRCRILWRFNVGLGGIDARILRLPCETFADFSYVKEDQVLQGSLLATFNDKSEEQCADQCVLNYYCKSINIKNDATVCQLNSQSAADVSDNCSLVAGVGWKFKSTNYTDRMVVINNNINNI